VGEPACGRKCTPGMIGMLTMHVPDSRHEYQRGVKNVLLLRFCMFGQKRRP
jgi:hypothetical protein